MNFCMEKGLAMCGLACVLCSVQDCPGCKARGCEHESDCTVLRCVTEKGLNGCYTCPDFPCEEKMLKGTRKRAFNRYARRFGQETLLQRLQSNHERGVVYHRPDGILGDYDLPETEDAVLRLIHFGASDPYVRCPELKTEHFLLRLVRFDDAGPLLHCYGDPKAQALFNADNCQSDFCFHTEAEMGENIDFWLKAYQARAFIRFAIVDQVRAVPVGTIEMFGGENESGILRLDLAASYEKQNFIQELLEVCIRDFYLLFQVAEIRTKLPALAEERTAVCRTLGFCPQEKGDYWTRKDPEVF